MDHVGELGRVADVELLVGHLALLVLGALVLLLRLLWQGSHVHGDLF